jgi:acylphosphatase
LIVGFPITKEYKIYSPILFKRFKIKPLLICTMNKHINHISMRIHGKVQGVFFRASTQNKAQELGLKGFVQNETDGTVYLEAEGDMEALKKLEQWAHEGPDQARVDRVDVRELKELAGFQKFEQRR